jgi:2-polyprenyl-3-methyl-5-hydroxy-6-metoxy-1,4-benzoquinol methylase
MSSEQKRDFDREAAAWDEDPGRVKLASDIADAIVRAVKPTQEMDALDFGCGTGLVTLRLQPLVRTILGVDSSRGMLAVLEGKTTAQGLSNVRAQFADFENGEPLGGRFHLVVSSMALHHVPDTAGLLKRLHTCMRPGGMLAVADLDQEDGSFHSDNAGVVHFGFDRGHLKGLLDETGFYDVQDVTAATVVKEIAGKGTREFPVFLIVGTR